MPNDPCQQETDPELIKLLARVAVRAAELGREIVAVNRTINGPPGAAQKVNIIGALAVSVTSAP